MSAGEAGGLQAPPPPPWEGRSIATHKLRLVEFSAFMEQQRDPDTVNIFLLFKPKLKLKIYYLKFLFAVPQTFIRSHRRNTYIYGCSIRGKIQFI